MWGYRVSCVVTIVTKNRSVGIVVFIEESCVYASTRGLEDGPVRLCDVIPVYVWMSPETISGARDCVSYLPSEETGQSIMNMDTSEISINIYIYIYIYIYIVQITHATFFVNDFLRNGHRKPFWMSKNHFVSHFLPFQINATIFIL